MREAEACQELGVPETELVAGDAPVFQVLAAFFFLVGSFLTSYAAPPLVFALGLLAFGIAAFLWHRGAQAPNPSIERTCQGPLRAPCPAAHVER